MNAQHTPGRMTWKRRTDGSLFYVIGDHTTGPHAQGDIYIDEADLRRLAACWNACDGISDNDLANLEGHWGQGFVKERAARVAAEKQRDELLAALERIADPRNTHFAGDAKVVACAAIAKVKGGAA